MNLRGDVILTGATGFLGSHLMAALVERGVRVIVLGRGSAGANLGERIVRTLGWFGLEHRIGQVETTEVDLLKPACGLPPSRYDALSARAGTIIHCASDTRFSEGKRDEITATNLHALEGILHLAVDSHASFFHYLSTAYVAGRVSGSCPEELAYPRTFTNVYEETKALAEREVARRCEGEGLAYTILRPSIVYGDSRSGRTTRFNALYFPVRSLLCIRDIYREDILHRGGRQARACGMALQDDGILEMPLRVFLNRRGEINLIPIDYFVSAAMSILEHPEPGQIYHISSDSPNPVDDLTEYIQRFLKIRGIKIVEGARDEMPLTPPEALFRRFMEPYLPYLADTRRFVRRHAARVTSGLCLPELTYEVFERCMNYALSVDWGHEPESRPGEVSMN